MKRFLIFIILLTLLFSSCSFNKGTLTVDSYPKEAEVYLNEEYFGVTPLSKSLNIGKYKIEVKKGGYKIYSKEIEIKRGKETIVIANLERMVGGLSIKTDPEGANVYIDGKN
ncbi:MAG: PEGA domain-containing protein, partial [Caldisericia bacterium]|nr:PEGA domain-containing protein [Caldisericia bacterium]